MTGRARTNMNYYHFSVGRGRHDGWGEGGVGGRNEISSSRTPPRPCRGPTRQYYILRKSRPAASPPSVYDEKSVTHTTATPRRALNGIFLRTSAAPLTSHSIRVMYNASQYSRAMGLFRASATLSPSPPMV